MKRRHDDGKGSPDSLSEEISRKFRDKLQAECEKSRDSKRRWANELETIIEKVFPGNRLVIVGSSMNMFGLENCDCDMTLIISGSIFAVNTLSKIDKLFQKPRFSTTVKFTMFCIWFYFIAFYFKGITAESVNLEQFYMAHAKYLKIHVVNFESTFRSYHIYMLSYQRGIKHVYMDVYTWFN